MVERLILLNTPADVVRYGHMVQPQSFIDAQEQVKKAGGFQSRHFWDEYLDYFPEDPLRISPRIRDEICGCARREPEKHPIALIALIARIGDGVEATRLMAEVKAPTLLIWGARDRLLPVPATHSLTRYLAKAPVSHVILPDVGHCPPLEVPERFTRLIAAYVEAVVPVVSAVGPPR